MILEIVTTGTELLLGQIFNTNAPYLAEKLNEMGFDVVYQTTVGDNRERMAHVLQTALERADIVITSGGMGPTQGDITKEVTASLFNRAMYVHEPSLERIRTLFTRRQMAMPQSNERQAMIPEGAIVVDNDWGTAPGVILEDGGKTIINLPGPPRELESMFSHAIAPYLAKRYGGQGTIVSRVLHTYGISESALEERISDYITKQTNPTLALLVRPGGEIIVRLTAKAADKPSATALIAKLEEELRQQIGEYIFGVDGVSLGEVVGKALMERKLKISLAESCTGGLVTSRITDVPGSSSYLLGSVVCYDNSIKISQVGVAEATLREYGAVSYQTALQMAGGIRHRFGSDLGVGITGIAGPGGDTSDKPVGLVYVAIDGPRGSEHYKFNFSGERTYIKERTAYTVLNLIRKYLET
ncbi:competence/damage-inducible protein A [Propionispora hippei]|uniref:Putative competence-damage inducible protein n=1 Tax=Propionispora hippei DSM 15287 TaxID=1123003 RepID=A0A1M6DAG0_9FIRM|nr:competence/damage-inducible protein A [Propionispora hippei]SHI70120.1 nicotinamide-nucleotide amidase [Propionispora hippei DSM 15287]